MKVLCSPTVMKLLITVVLKATHSLFNRDVSTYAYFTFHAAPRNTYRASG